MGDVQFEWVGTRFITLIVESYVWGRGKKYITKSQVRHSTEIITDFNTGNMCNGRLAYINGVNNVTFFIKR